MNLIEMIYTKLSILYENFREEDDSPFFIDENKTKKPHVERVEDPCEISGKKCCAFVFRFKNPEIQ